MNEIIVIGGGLAGSEAALQIAKRKIKVKLYEMKPNKFSGAHSNKNLGEIVCSNSFKSNLVTNACGLLKEELRLLGSFLIPIADRVAVPAGQALAVDRERFAEEVTKEVENNEYIEIVREEVKKIPSDSIVIVATGPLTSEDLSKEILRITGENKLFFYDAASPIIEKESIDMNIAFYGNRYDEERGREEDELEWRDRIKDIDASYINLPMNKEEYDDFVKELLSAEVVFIKEAQSHQRFNETANIVLVCIVPVETHPRQDLGSIIKLRFYRKHIITVHILVCQHTRQNSRFGRILLRLLKHAVKQLVFYDLNAQSQFVQDADDIDQRNGMGIDRVKQAAVRRGLRKQQERFDARVNRSHSQRIVDHAVRKRLEHHKASQTTHKAVAEEVDLEFAVGFTRSERAHADHLGVQTVPDCRFKQHALRQKLGGSVLVFQYLSEVQHMLIEISGLSARLILYRTGHRGGGEVDQPRSLFKAETDTVLHTAYVDILDVRAAGEMLDARGTVEHRIDRHFKQSLEAVVICYITVKHLYAVKFFFHRFVKIVYQHAFDAINSGREPSLTQHTVSRSALCFQELSEDMDPHKSGRACQQDIADRAFFSVQEGGFGIL